MPNGSQGSEVLRGSRPVQHHRPKPPHRRRRRDSRCVEAARRRRARSERGAHAGTAEVVSRAGTASSRRLSAVFDSRARPGPVPATRRSRTARRARARRACRRGRSTSQRREPGVDDVAVALQGVVKVLVADSVGSLRLRTDDERPGPRRSAPAPTARMPRPARPHGLDTLPVGAPVPRRSVRLARPRVHIRPERPA